MKDTPKLTLAQAEREIREAQSLKDHPCKVPECAANGGIARRGLYCRAHSQQLYRHGHITNPVVRAYRQPPGPCRIAGCTDRAVVRGLCPAHIQRAYRGRLNPEVPIQRRRQEDK